MRNNKNKKSSKNKRELAAKIIAGILMVTTLLGTILPAMMM